MAPKASGWKMQDNPKVSRPSTLGEWCIRLVGTDSQLLQRKQWKQREEWNNNKTTRQSTSDRAANVECVHQLVHENRLITVYTISEDLKLNKDTCHQGQDHASLSLF